MKKSGLTLSKTMYSPGQVFQFFMALHKHNAYVGIFGVLPNLLPQHEKITEGLRIFPCVYGRLFSSLDPGG